MKKRAEEVRRKFLKIRMSGNELQQLKQWKNKSDERTLSNYVRKVALQKPVVIKYRNESADDFLRSMLELKKDLNAIGNNFNQAVHKLHPLHTIPEFRLWIQQQEALEQSLLQKVSDIQKKVSQLYEQWLLK